MLFLFVVMMLDIDFAELRAGYMKYFPVGAHHRLYRAGGIDCICLAPGKLMVECQVSRPASPIPDLAASDEHRGHRTVCCTPITFSILKLWESYC